MGRILGRISLVSAAHAKTTVVLIALSTLAIGLGMTQLETDADLLKILPKGEPTTVAAQNASQEFRGFYDFVTVFYKIDPDKCARVSAAQLPYRLSPAQCGNVTDEVYVRGMDEIGKFIQQEIPEARHAIDLAGIVKVVNWTNSGYFGDKPMESILDPLLAGEPMEVGKPYDAAFAMPGTDPRGELLYEAAFRGANAADDSVNDVVAPTYKAGRTLIFFDTHDGDLNRVELGRKVFAMVDAYKAAIQACDDDDPATGCELEWNVFSEEGLAVRGVSSLDAHASDVTKRDISRLAPLIIWAIIVVLYAAFRDARVILVAAANLFVSFVWTAGIMGWMHIPFSALNMTIVPLILGVGIDYGIHMVSEFLEHKSEGIENDEAFRRAGSRAGIAMTIATITTVSGLALMAWSPSVLMAQLGVVSSIALLVTFLFTLSFIPALLTMTGRSRRDRRQKGSRWILGMSRAIHHARWYVIIFLVVASGAAGLAVRDLEPEPFGNPELNYPPGDRVRDDAETISDLFFGGETDTQSNFLIVEGDLTQPKAHVFIDRLMEALEQDEDIQGFNTAALTRIIRAWVAIDGGTPDALVQQIILGQAPEETGARDLQYPQTQEEIKQTLDELFASPFSNFMTVLLDDQDYTIGTVTYDTRQGLDFNEVERIWHATQRVILETQDEVYGSNQNDPGFTGVRAHAFGNNAFSYLFITKEQPWVNTVGIVAFAMVIGLIAFLTRNLRATLCTTLVMFITSLWWLGALPVMGVGLSVGLMLPMVFIMAIGTDDAIHLIWNMERTHDRTRVYRFVGKAVLLTSVTTLVAFGIFSFQTDLLVRQTLLATAVAVVVMWVATMLVVPLFYPPPEEPRPVPVRSNAGSRPQAQSVPGPKARSPVTTTAKAVTRHKQS